MLKETENEETRFFCHISAIGGISIGGAGPPPSLATPMIVTSMLYVILKFCVLFCLFALLCACQSDTNGSILYDHAN